MSTIESLNPLGLPYHPTKSLCSPSVFNTAITRATSLIVAVGNPYTLLAVEKKMDKDNRCWAEYFRQCIEANAFKGASDSVIQELRYLVEEKVCHLPENATVRAPAGYMLYSCIISIWTHVCNQRCLHAYQP